MPDLKPLTSSSWFELLLSQTPQDAANILPSLRQEQAPAQSTHTVVSSTHVSQPLSQPAPSLPSSQPLPVASAPPVVIPPVIAASGVVPNGAPQLPTGFPDPSPSPSLEGLSSSFLSQSTLDFLIGAKDPSALTVSVNLNNKQATQVSSEQVRFASD
jgi:hypothetical protein